MLRTEGLRSSLGRAPLIGQSSPARAVTQFKCRSLTASVSRPPAKRPSTCSTLRRLINPTLRKDTHCLGGITHYLSLFAARPGIITQESPFLGGERSLLFLSLTGSDDGIRSIYRSIRVIRVPLTTFIYDQAYNPNPKGFIADCTKELAHAEENLYND